MHNAIIVQGNIGSGKSTLCHMLSDVWGIPVLHEPVVDNPFLPEFYSNPDRNAFSLQVYMLHERFKQLWDICDVDKYLMDLSMYGNVVFTKVMARQGYITEKELELYLDMFRNFKSFATSPKLMVYLQCSPETSLERARKRGREYEKDLDLGYLSMLRGEFDKWYNEYDEGKKIIIDVDNLNIVERIEDFQLIKGIIENSL